MCNNRIVSCLPAIRPEWFRQLATGPDRKAAWQVNFHDVVLAKTVRQGSPVLALLGCRSGMD